MDPVFHPDGEYFLPTQYAAGPWDAGLLHGGATAALVVREIERVPALASLSLARLTLELFRPVRVTPLRVMTRVAREGKKIQLVEASVRDGDVEVARASGLRLRRHPLDLPEEAAPVWRPPPGPDEGREPRPLISETKWFFGAFETRAVEGDIGDPGPAAVWFRLRRPIIAGEEPTGAMRAAAVADFGNGISSSLDVGRFTFVNPDLTVYLHREPAGEWLLLRSRTGAGNAGIGLAESEIADHDGPIGRGLQSLLLERRQP